MASTPYRSASLPLPAQRGGPDATVPTTREPDDFVRPAGCAFGPSRTVIRVIALLGAVSGIGLDAAPLAAVPDRVDFNRDVRRILSNTCLKCHGPDVKGSPSGLRLDQANFAHAPHRNKSGRTITALVPGKPEDSEVWRRITSKDATTVMPPPDSLHQLTMAEKNVLRRWIEQGAAYQGHWAYRPPVEVPPLKSSPALARLQHPIDQYLAAELDRRGIAFSNEADRRTLFRRLSLDLTGLPPTASDIEAFVADSRPDAYQAAVDRLLASPHYGERMAVPWLDLVRFADSTGLHGDQRLNNFPFRDYVIDSFNRNKPFDQFTIEQIAGDLLPNATTEQQVASGFNRLNMVTREGGAQVQEYLAKYSSDRVRTVSTAWLGSTLACAECHDHKYDPFTIRDFYAFSAYFADVKQWGVYRHFIYTPETELAVHTDDYPFPPEIEVESSYLKARDARLRQQLQVIHLEGGRSRLARPEGNVELDAWVRQVAPHVDMASGGWVTAKPETVDTNPQVTAIPLPDGSVRFENPVGYAEKRFKQPLTRHVLHLSTPAIPLSTLRLELLPDQVHGGLISRDQRLHVEISVQLSIHRAGAAKPEAVEVAEAFAENETENFFNGRPRVSLRALWRSSAALAHTRQSAVFQLRQPLMLESGDRLIATIHTAPVNFHQRDYLGEIGRIRISVSSLGSRLPGEALSGEDASAFSAPKPSAAQRERLAALYFHATQAFAQPGTAELLREILECREGRAATMVTVAAPPRTTRVLARGNWQDESGEIVTPAPPRFLTEHPSEPGAPRQTRLDLARWIMSPSNPLTARTFVNRTWKLFFGTGLSSAVEDLGMQGEYPSHPELLDALSVRFRDSGWDIKALVRLIVTSHAYRQASRERADLREIDPQNRLLAHQSARRLDAEFIRDHALSVSGLLHREIGGPSALPYQPAGYYEQLNFPLRDYVADRDERQYRRGLYQHWQRTFLHPMLANFDAPSREECTAARTDSNTPQQALTLLNDPSFVEAARVFAESLLQVPPAQRLDLAFLRTLGRPPESRERASLEQFHHQQISVFRARPADAAAFTSIGLSSVPPGIDRVELAAWTALTRVLFNLNETIMRY